MEYGLIPKLNQFVDNNSVEIQKVQSSNETSQIGQKDQLKQIQQEAIAKEKEVSAAKKTEAQQSSSKYEVTLSNTNFGFNDQSKDFYVKVSRGSAENQYPTESMMRLKAYMMGLNTAS
jgi:uncharacterized FlaG/YvyC family protein